MVWFEFILCCVLIALAGTQLSRYGDAIADKTGLGRTWIGLVLLATVTSLPELVTGVTSVTVADVPDIAVGDILGSCVFNLLIIVVLDFLYQEKSVYTKASQGHILSAAFGVMMIAFVGFQIVLSSNGPVRSLGWVSLATPLIFFLYIVAMRTVFRYEKRQIAEFADAEKDLYPDLTLRQAVARYIAAAMVVVLAGIWLPFVASQLAEEMGWAQSFVGTLFVSIVTSLPEVVVTIAALRLGAVDLAVGNLFGSNLFNVMILGIDDLLYVKGPLYAAIAPVHAVSALSAVMMTGVAIVALFYRPQQRLFRTVGWVSVFLFTTYVINSYVVYLFGSATH